jgi:serine/threonine protein kinase/WD40 repeat protein
MAVTNTQVWALTDEHRAVLEDWLVEFERTWDEGRLGARVGELPPGPLRFPALVELVKIDLERNWQRGNPLTVESYLARYPELGTPETVPADLLQVEYEARRQSGSAADLSDFAGRFPARADDLHRLVEQGPATTTVAAPSTLSPAGPPSTLTATAPASGLPQDRLGRYELRRSLGSGGMGSVYLAFDTQLQRLVALKVPRFAADADPEARERFYREARAAATLRHPNLCPVYDAGEVGGVHYLTMAYIEGPSLAERVRSGPPLSPAEAAELVRRLAEALAVAHAGGVIHRDLKPSNVLLAADGQPVVTDFGLARRADSSDVRLTHSGAVLGTPAYMSPEQAAGDPERVGPASDVYSLGAMLYELATGRLPFAGGLADVLWQIRSEEPKRPSAVRPDVDPHLEEIIMRAMAKKIEDRYPGMGEFAAALASYLREERAGPVNRIAPYLAPRPQAAAPPAAAAPPSPRRPARRWRWRRAVALALVAGLAVLTAQVVIRYRDKDGNDKSKVIDDIGKNSPIVVEDKNGKKIVEGRVPEASPKPAGEQPRVSKGVVAAPQRLPGYWDVSPDGKTLVRVYDEDVELWDTATGTLRGRMKAASKDARPASFSPDGRLLAVGSYRRIQVWNVTDGKDLFEFKEPPDAVYGLAFTPDGKQLCAFDRSGYTGMWDMATGEAKPTSAKLPRGAWYWSPDGRTILVPRGQYVNSMTLLHTADMTTEEIRFEGHFDYLHDACFSQDGKRLLLGHRDEVQMYDIERKKDEKIHHLHTKNIYRVSLSPDGKLAASGSEDQTAAVWDLVARKERATLKGFDGPVGVRFSPDGKTLLAWGQEGTTVRRWDVASGQELAPLSGHDGRVTTVFYRNEGKTLVVGERDGRVTVYDAAGLPK